MRADSLTAFYTIRIISKSRFTEINREITVNYAKFINYLISAVKQLYRIQSCQLFSNITVYL